MAQLTFHKNTSKEEINNIMSDFASIKVSVMRKASRLSSEMNSITIGPNSEPLNNDEILNASDNIENEINSCNVDSSKSVVDIPKIKRSSPKTITFSIPKIMVEAELEREENVRKIIEKRRQDMEQKGREIQKEIEIRRSEVLKRLEESRLERERRNEEEIARIHAEAEITAKQEEMRRKHEYQLHIQRAQEKKLKMQQEQEEMKRILAEKTEFAKQISECKSNFDIVSNEVVSLLKTCKNKESDSLVVFITKLKELSEQIDLINNKTKSNDQSIEDVQNATVLLQGSEQILQLIKQEIDQVNLYYEEQLAAEALTNMPKAQAAIEYPNVENYQVAEVINSQPIDANDGAEKNKDDSEIVQREVAVVPNADNIVSNIFIEKNKDGLHDWCDKESLQIHASSQEFLDIIMKRYSDFATSESTKHMRFECQKAINIPVNAISGINEQHLKDKFQRLHSLLLGSGMAAVNTYPQLPLYCKDILAKKLVNQAETLISSKPEMAFPIAAVSIALWNEHKDFGSLLLAHLHKVCPFTVPIFMPQLEGQSSKEYYMLLGYKYTEDGTVESQDKYLKRMSGVMSFYAALIVTNQRREVQKEHPFGLQNAWRWFAVTLNCKPIPGMADVSATLILDMLQITGSAMWNAYPKQFPKLLTLLIQQYYPLMKDNSSIGGGPLVRLEEFLKNTLANGSIQPPKGQLPPNFW